MSTILEALRKAEEERQASISSARERLFFFTLGGPPSSQRKSWMVALVLGSIGLVTGAGLAFLRLDSVVLRSQGGAPQERRPAREAFLRPPAALPVLPQKESQEVLSSFTAEGKPSWEAGTLDLGGPFAPGEKALIPRSRPPGPMALGGEVPQIALNLLQWSPQRERRLAFVRVDGGPMLMVQEGDTVSGLTVEGILPDRVKLRSGPLSFEVKVQD